MRCHDRVEFNAGPLGWRLRTVWDYRAPVLSVGGGSCRTCSTNSTVVGAFADGRPPSTCDDADPASLELFNDIIPGHGTTYSALSELLGQLPSLNDFGPGFRDGEGSKSDGPSLPLLRKGEVIIGTMLENPF